MRNFLLFCFLFSFSGFASAQLVPVTFQVNMEGNPVSTEGVHIAGNFQLPAGYPGNWNPATTEMEDPNNDLIYTCTVQIPPGTYQYKFINGNEWNSSENAPAECTVSATFDREVVVGANGKVIPPVRFNQCPTSLLLSVNMNGIPVSPNGVHVMGDFQQAAGYPSNWDPSSVLLEDLNQDGYYEKKITVPEGNYRYLFVNGNTLAGQENPPAACTVSDGTGIPKRNAILNSGGPFPLFNCFNACGTCIPADTSSGVRGPWNEDVFYEIFVRSFYDSNNDGIGDFKGITQKMDYLNDGNPDTKTDLGVTGIWLMPIMKSPSYHGYDITDYYATQPSYGTMAEFEEMLDSAHKRGIRVILDLVINHTSSQHPWFTQSANNQNGYRDWYVWRDANPGFTGPWGQQVWHQRNGKFYYGVFYNGMPDLNLEHPAVKQEIFNITNFWLNKGVDGFRLDAIQYLVENGNQLSGTTGTFQFLTEFNQVCKSNNPECFNIGEVWNTTPTIIPYVQNQKLDACFEFDLAYRILAGLASEDPSTVLNQLITVKQSYPGLSYGTFLTNHDQDRVASVFQSNTARLKQAATIYLTLPGIPFVYYGEEIGMIGNGPDEEKRTPMQWSSGSNGGFTTGNPWQAFQSNLSTHNVATMNLQPNSLLSHYKKLIHLRNEHPALSKGVYKPLVQFSPSLLAYARTTSSSAVLVISNFSGQARNVSVTLESSGFAPGIYFVTNGLNTTSMGSIAIDENGGFQNWTPPSGTLIPGNETWILSLTTENPVLGVENQVNPVWFDLYPNPAGDRVFVRGIHPSTGLEITVSDAMGKTVWSGLGLEASGISTQSFPPGVYQIRIQNQAHSHYGRLLIVR